MADKIDDEIANIEKAHVLRNRIMENARKSVEELRTMIETAQNGEIELLRKMRFEALAFHPTENRKINLIESLNQIFTCLVSCVAVEKLLRLHEGKTFKMNLGTAGGFDIESTDGEVIAETFAGVDPGNNRKLGKDIKRLNKKAADNKYVFFYSPRYQEGRQEELKKKIKLGGKNCVQVWAVNLFPAKR